MERENTTCMERENITWIPILNERTVKQKHQF